MFVCLYCETKKEDDAWFSHTGLCGTCIKVKDLSKIYTMNSLLKSLETIYVREEEPIKKRTDAVVQGVELRSAKKNKLMAI
jgi:hypothetical protein